MISVIRELSKLWPKEMRCSKKSTSVMLLNVDVFMTPCSEATRRRSEATAVEATRRRSFGSFEGKVHSLDRCGVSDGNIEP